MHLTNLIASLLLLASSGVLSSPVPKHTPTHKTSPPKQITIPPQVAISKATTPKATSPKVTTPNKPLVPINSNPVPDIKPIKKASTWASPPTANLAPIKPLQRANTLGSKPTKPFDPCSGRGIQRRGCTPEPADGNPIPAGKSGATKVDLGQGDVGIPTMGQADAPTHVDNIMKAAAKSKANTEPMGLNTPKETKAQRDKTTRPHPTAPGRDRDEEPPAIMKQPNIADSNVMSVPKPESKIQAPTNKEAKKVATGPQGSGQMMMGVNMNDGRILTGSDLYNEATGQSGQSGQRSGIGGHDLRNNPKKTDPNA